MNSGANHKRFMITVALLSILCMSLIYTRGQAQATQTENDDSGNDMPAIKGEYVVKLKDGDTEGSERSMNESGGKVTGKLDKLKALKVEVSEKDQEKFLKKILKDKNVEWVEPNYLVEAAFLPNDPSWSMQWGPEKIDSVQAWDLESGDPGVLVVVVDTGVCYTHPDLAGAYVTGGYNWVSKTNDPMDDHGHGTHVAGTIAAKINNALGIAGIAQVKIMAEKFLGSSGSGSSWDAAQAIIHGVNVGKTISNRVILSNSWGSSSSSSVIEDAMNYAHQNGALIIAAAGNLASSNPFYPAAYPEVMSVSATDSNDHLASFSNYGNKIELAAPGVNIYSTFLNGAYASLSGTSMAAPHVTGVAALVWSRFPDYSNDQVRMVLDNTADDLGSPGWDQYFGYGRVDAYLAMQGIQPHDIRVNEVDTAPLLLTGYSVTINGTIRNIGSNAESNVNVQLMINGTVTDTKIISEIEVWQTIEVEFDYQAMNIGTCNITVYSLPVNGETSIIDNWKSTVVSAQNPGQILLVSDDDGKFHWSTGTSVDAIASALNRNGCNVTVWSESRYGRPSLSMLLKFGVVVWTCGNYWNWAVDPTDADTLLQYFNNGGSILLEGEDIAASHASDDFMQSIAHAIGQIDNAGTMNLTVTQRSNPVCQGLPSSFGWLANPISPDGVAPANGGSEVVEYSGSSWSAVVTFGNGGPRSTIYFAFPLSSLEQGMQENLVLNSVRWLQKPYLVKVEPKNPEITGLKFYIDRVAYQLPGSALVKEGPHRIAVWPSYQSDSGQYIFDHWEDEAGQPISSELIFTLNVQANRTFYVCFKEWTQGLLTLSTITSSPVPSITAQESQLTVTVINNGTVPIYDINVELILPSNMTLSSTESQQVVLASIQPGQSYNVNWHITANEAGAFRIIVASNGTDGGGAPTVYVVRLNMNVVD